MEDTPPSVLQMLGIEGDKPHVTLAFGGATFLVLTEEVRYIQGAWAGYAAAAC